jgi:hypothetical protein
MKTPTKQSTLLRRQRLAYKLVIEMAKRRGMETPKRNNPAAGEEFERWLENKVREVEK